MPKERTGYVFQDEQKRWFARLTYTDEAGARRNVKFGRGERAGEVATKPLKPKS